jgi:hypothetical protein
MFISEGAGSKCDKSRRGTLPFNRMPGMIIPDTTAAARPISNTTKACDAFTAASPSLTAAEDDQQPQSRAASKYPSWTRLSKDMSGQMAEASTLVNSDEAQAQFDHWIAEGIPIPLMGEYVDQGRIVIRIGVDAPITEAILKQTPD